MDLVTSRLRIRSMRESDAPTVWAYRNDPAVAELQDWDLPYTLERTHDRLAAQAAFDDVTPGEWINFAVEELTNPGEVIGDVACHLDEQSAVAEIGYTFRTEFQGKGYAREATSALVDRIFAIPTVHRIEASLDPENVPSMRVVESLGMTFESLSRKSYFMRGGWEDDLRYAMLREEREAWLNRPRLPPSSIEFVEITHDDSHLWARVVTHHSQERFVSPVITSFRHALFPEVVNGAPAVPWLRGVLADGERVGFVMTTVATEQLPTPFLWRLLIDRMQQRRGIGSMVLAAVQAHLTDLGHRCMEVSWHQGRGGPEQFYFRHGFVPTGNLIGGDEIEARLSW